MDAFDLAAGRAWALSEADLFTVMSIAARAGEGPEAVALRLGRPLENTRSVVTHGDVAVVPLDGPMFRRANILTEVSGATSTEQFAQDFQAAIDNPAVAGIVLDISSPGGEVSGVNETAAAIFAARARKPIVAYVGDQAASGAYWIASAADRIVMDATATVGSIGVVGRWMKRQERGGITSGEIVSSQSPNKRLDPETDLGRAAIQREVDQVAEVFIEAVARHRGVSTQAVIKNFGGGGTEVGAEAVRLGMADAVGSLQSAIADLSGRAQAPAPSRRSVMMTTESNLRPMTVEPLDKTQLAALYPEVAEALRAEGREAARHDQAAAAKEIARDAAATERARILAIDEATLPGHEALARASIDAGDTAESFALAQAKALKAAGGAHLDTLRADEAALAKLAALRPVAPTEPGKPDPTLPLDERCKAEWDRSESLRAEFGGSFEVYLAYAKAEASGRVRRLQSKSAA